MFWIGARNIPHDSVILHKVDSVSIDFGEGRVHIHIKRQTRGYKMDNPATQHEKALPPMMFRKLLSTAEFPRELARTWLACGALVFVMRSYEYTFTGNGERKTRPVRPCDIVFWTGARNILHDSATLHKADSV